MVEQPRVGLSVHAKVERVVDGDTMEVSVTRKFKVRVLGTDTYEKSTDIGKNATIFAKAFLENREILLFIPAPANEATLTGLASFERILADIWVDGRLFRDIMAEKGFVKDLKDQHLK